jgi:membrane-bound serine protease (ClpP class)
VELHFSLILVIYLVGAGLLIAEMFVPGGITGAIGVALMGTAIVFTFRQYGFFPGAGVTVVTVVGLPIVILKAIERNSLKKQISAGEGYVASQDGLEQLLDTQGEALTKLRPAGMAQLDGRRVDVVAESGMIAKGATVRVVMVEGNRVVVRQTAPPPEPEDGVD